jgi:hypothetical protein
VSSCERAKDTQRGHDTNFAVDFETFQRILNRPGGFRDPGEPEEYCRGFQVFDKDMTGYIGVGQLKYILTNLGEKMTDEEVDELLKAVDTSSGQVNYTGKSCIRPTRGVLRTHWGLNRPSGDFIYDILTSLQTLSGQFSPTRRGRTVFSDAWSGTASAKQRLRAAGDRS